MENKGLQAPIFVCQGRWVDILLDRLGFSLHSGYPSTVDRRHNDGTGRSISPAAGGHVVALMTRRGGRRDSNYCQLMKA